MYAPPCNHTATIISMFAAALDLSTPCSALRHKLRVFVRSTFFFSRSPRRLSHKQQQTNKTPTTRTTVIEPLLKTPKNNNDSQPYVIQRFVRARAWFLAPPPQQQYRSFSSSLLATAVAAPFFTKLFCCLSFSACSFLHDSSEDDVNKRVSNVQRRHKRKMQRGLLRYLPRITYCSFF